MGLARQDSEGEGNQKGRCKPEVGSLVNQERTNVDRHFLVFRTGWMSPNRCKLCGLNAGMGELAELAVDLIELGSAKALADGAWRELGVALLREHPLGGLLLARCQEVNDVECLVGGAQGAVALIEIAVENQMDRGDQVAHRPGNQVPDGKVSHAAALLLGLTEQSKQRLHRADEVKL